MGDDKKFTQKVIHGGKPTEEDVALMLSEERRLREMGIDPDGDPGEIMREVAARAKALREKQNPTE